jgi:hypothetical protein
MYYHADFDLFVQITRRADFQKGQLEKYRQKLIPLAGLQKDGVQILKALSALPVEDSLTERDFFDIARTVIGRFLNAAILSCQLLYASDAPTDALTAEMQNTEHLMVRMVELLGAHEDYSLLKTLDRLERVHEVDPGFERVLKSNAECDYCRSYIYENAKALYLPEMRCLFNEVKEAVREGREVRRDVVRKDAEKIREDFFETPLAAMSAVARSLTDILADAASDVAALRLSIC